MSGTIAEKLVTIAENEIKLYNEALGEGYTEGYTKGYNDGLAVSKPEDLSDVLNKQEEKIATLSAILDKKTLLDDNDNLGEFFIGNTTDLVWNNVTEIPSTIAEGLVEITKNSNITSARLPALQKIPDNMFYACSNLTSADVSAATEIGAYAFYQCTNLTSIDLPKVTTLSTSAFANCTSLAISTLPHKLEVLGPAVFDNCGRIKSLTFPDTFIRAFRNAISNCNGLTSVTFKGTPTQLSTTTFTNCPNLTTINVPWAEGAVKNAPWGAPEGVEIVYNYKGD